MDSYKLVSRRSIALTLGVGAVAALVSLGLNTQILDHFDIGITPFRRYLAPLIEESAKATLLILWIRLSKVGFIVDTAILGFAIGTGFALVENIHFLENLETNNLVLWFVRGFGTAIMHGSTTAIFGILSKSLTERHDSIAIHFFVPGLLTCVAIHSLFNHFILPPLAMTLIELAVMPSLVMLLFRRSEAATSHWLGNSFDSDLEVIEAINSGQIRDNPTGKYLQSLKSRFPGSVVADMLCLLRIQIELSMQAKAILMTRRAGIKLPVGEEIKLNLEELRYLNKSIGPTGKLALKPFLKTSRRDIWELYMLSK